MKKNPSLFAVKKVLLITKNTKHSDLIFVICYTSFYSPHWKKYQEIFTFWEGSELDYMRLRR